MGFEKCQVSTIIVLCRFYVLLIKIPSAPPIQHSLLHELSFKLNISSKEKKTIDLDTDSNIPSII